MNRLQAAEQIRRALQMFAETLTDTEAMEIAVVYPAWEPDKQYKGGTILSHGINSVGDPQLYRVVEPGHKSQADWPPDAKSALYTPIGLTEDGYPEWSQPAGVHDAFNTGDIVSFNEDLYESLIDGNTTVPGSDERWWKKVAA